MRQGLINSTKVLLKEIPKTEKKTESGLIIPNVGKGDPQISGIVLQVGKGLPSIPMEIEVGQTVLFFPHAVQRFNIDDEPVMLLDCRDCLFRYFPESNL
jgi:co-chaperonin GroES (HSP10)